MYVFDVPSKSYLEPDKKHFNTFATSSYYAAENYSGGYETSQHGGC